jgi:hypothetical protein
VLLFPIRNKLLIDGGSVRSLAKIYLLGAMELHVASKISISFDK